MNSLNKIIASVIMMCIATSVFSSLNENKSDVNLEAQETLTFEYMGSPGGGDDEWLEPDNWQPRLQPINCNGSTEICVVNLNPGQSLISFLSSISSLDYDDVVEHPQITPKN